MDNEALIDSFSDFKYEKNIDRVSLMAILEESIRCVLKKKYDSSKNYDIIVNPDQGDLEIWRNRIVVKNGTVKDPNKEIELSTARKIEMDFEIGEEVTEKVELKSIGRRAILSLRQNLLSKVNEYDNTNTYKKIKNKIGEIINVEVYHILPKQIIMKDDEQNEMVLPKQEQIPNDFFRKGDPVKVLVKKVDWKDSKPFAVLTRKDEAFLEELFKLEIPEVSEGLITVKKVARIPGEKAKVSVESYDDRIDPVGACVGMKGSRIHPIVRELKNENIDVINYTTNIQLYITRALSPAKISMMEVNEEQQYVNVYVKLEEISKAIGRGGQNIRLASQLTGYKIHIFRDFPYEDDVELTEFSDEIEPKVIEKFHQVGLNTAKSILNYRNNDLSKRTNLEEKIIKKVIFILKKEFEEELNNINT
ncbi:transcription termination factor NusA [Blattabacterium punctulatus]|uniref:Transcription termination/antitermination protein NusA n=1 Tax=Blattabacterium punctulatus TaxID=164514 RepID=A0ABN5M246_9FLAO|nr:transcription termination factor NusA [Blattabacterium punctulatus]AWU39610.1 transcription termination/antitermination protein NusA [Blattabacterium punctulatus]AWU40155.1 transcription termination/antitermination protein NusA [Blattabacterium punctulatus]AWU42411.1 transcription termination/antitermination protein NusA [Blattabacterium punctulatus]AWU44603.1 transcription termination/antitermination protein NusA [Blattabacterium punctulatus]